MACDKPNCCRKAKAVESEMTMKATAELQESVSKDLEQEDKTLSELLEDDENADNDISSSNDHDSLS